MKERLLTAAAIFFIVAVVLLTKIIVGTTIVVDVLFGFMVVFASFEMAKLLKKTGRLNYWYVIVAFPVLLYALIYIEMACQVTALWIWISALLLTLVSIAVSYFITLFSFATTENEMREQKIRTSKSAYAFQKAMNTFLGFLYPSVLLILLFPINHLAEINYLFGGSLANVETISTLLVITCFIIPIICDTFAYLVGKTFGGKKLAPTISPNKTIAGAVGGVVFTVALMLVLYFILNSVPSLTTVLSTVGCSWWAVALIALVGSIFCEIGDLCESLLKRKADVKDSGDILPGHGGMLDRIDGLLFVIPTIFVVLLIIVL